MENGDWDGAKYMYRAGNSEWGQGVGQGKMLVLQNEDWE